MTYRKVCLGRRRPRGSDCGIPPKDPDKRDFK